MGEWKKVERGRHRCERCGSFFEGVAWHWFPRPNVFTHVLCEPCVEILTAPQQAVREAWATYPDGTWEAE